MNKINKITASLLFDFLDNFDLACCLNGSFMLVNKLKIRDNDCLG